MWQIEEAKRCQKETVKHRRYLHENAEVGFELPKTKKYIVETLEGYGYQPKMLKNGVIVAEIAPKEDTRAGFTLLRADMDALKMREESGLPYACTSGNMHACGHDMHTAALLTSAKILSKNREKLPRPVRFLFQPAEEILEGGAAAVREGVCQGVERAFALHVVSGVPFACGSILFSGEEISAPSADVFEIGLTGKSCHGASPHEGVDAIVPAQAICVALQARSKEIPLGEGLITVGYLSGGSSGNILAGQAVIKGTCRAFDEEIRAYIKDRIREIVRGIAKAYRVKAKAIFSGGCPGLRQDKEVRAQCLTSFQKAFGEMVVDLSDEKRRVGASEDFAYISREVPSLLVSVSAGGENAYPLHHPRIVFDEKALSVCVATHLLFASGK